MILTLYMILRMRASQMNRRSNVDVWIVIKLIKRKGKKLGKKIARGVIKKPVRCFLGHPEIVRHMKGDRLIVEYPILALRRDRRLRFQKKSMLGLKARHTEIWNIGQLVTVIRGC